MALFNFIETFFFISLGITFVLILLIVYHFKQRIVTIEQKNDTMFEIINNVVKELNTVRNSFRPVPPFFYNQVNNPVESTNINKQSNNTVESSSNQEFIKPIILNDKQSIETDDYDSDEDDYDNDKDDYDSDKDDDEDSDIYSDEDDSDDIDIDIDEKQETNDDDKYTDGVIDIIELPVNSDIKIINIDSQQHTDFDSINNIDTQIESQLIDSEVKNNIQMIIEKIEESTDDNNNNNDIDVDIDADNDNKEQIEETKNIIQDSKEIYRKMNLQTLKTLVITKGLCSDPSKMKKPDLLKLLEDCN